MYWPPIAPRAQELLEAIWKPTTVWQKIVGVTDPRAELLTELAKCANIAVIPGILQLLFDSSRDVATATSDCLHTILTKAIAEDLFYIDFRIRKHTYFRIADHFWYADSWLRLKPGDVANAPKSETSQASVWGLMSSHDHGRVREAAIKCLNKINSGDELPYLLIRLNDWSETVRSVARKAVQARMTPGYVPHFVQNAYLVLHLSECGRADHREVVEWFIQSLVRPEYRQLLFHMLDKLDTRARHACFQQLLAQSTSDSAWVIAYGIDSTDMILRLHAAKAIQRSLASPQVDIFLAKMERDKFMPIRREAIRLQMERQSESADALLRLAALDNSSAMREVARFFLAKRGMTNIAQLYRDAFNRPGNKAIAIKGLGETGTREDVALVRPFLYSSMNREKAAASFAMGALGDDQIVPELLPLVNDVSGKVTQAAAKAITKHIQGVKPEDLWRTVGTSPLKHVRRSAIDLLSRTGAWSGLPYLIRLLGDENPETVALARSCIETRFDRVFTSPTSDETTQIKEALESTASEDNRLFFDKIRKWLELRSR